MKLLFWYFIIGRFNITHQIRNKLRENILKYFSTFQCSIMHSKKHTYGLKIKIILIFNSKENNSTSNRNTVLPPYLTKLRVPKPQLVT